MSKDYSLQGRGALGYKTWTPRAGQPLAQAESACRTACAVGGPSGAAGLSKPHIRTEGACQKPLPSITWYPGASLVDVNVPRLRPQQPHKDAKPRGKIKEWSAASRARLKCFLGTLRREELAHALVVTLTYPADFPAPEDHAVYKGHLHTLQIYLRRKWPACSGIWKLEFQSRGAAHYHLMLYGLHGVELEVVRTWVRTTWYRIAHNGDRHRGMAATQVDQIKSVGGAVSYLIKYLSKDDQTMPGNFGGRYWGKINKPFLPAVEPVIIEQEEKRALLVRRIARKKMQKDVEHSRWKRFLDREYEQYSRVGGRLFWETLKSRRHSSKDKIDEEGYPKQRYLFWQFKDGCPLEIDGELYYRPCEYGALPFCVDLVRRDIRQLPKRWKARNNDRVRIMCDAAAFMKGVERLESPASTFRAWSIGCE